MHVNLVNKTNVPGEEEYLFAPYSAFTVLSARWNAGTAAAPHAGEAALPRIGRGEGRLSAAGTPAIEQNKSFFQGEST